MDPPNDEFQDTIKGLLEILEPLGIRWAVTGAVAANMYRRQVRTSMDLDILLTLADRPIGDVAEALRGAKWDVTIYGETLIRANHTRYGHLDMLASSTDYEIDAIKRSNTTDLDETHAYKTLAAEDVIILKAVANRWQDVADIESILEADIKLDWGYIDKWAEVFVLEDNLNQHQEVIRVSRERSKRQSKPITR